jgi:hypothetical protein
MKNETKIILFLVAVGIFAGYSYYKQLPYEKSKERVLSQRSIPDESSQNIYGADSDFWKSQRGLNVLSKISVCVSAENKFNKTNHIEAENNCKKNFDQCISSSNLPENKSDEFCISKVNRRLGFTSDSPNKVIEPGGFLNRMNDQDKKDFFNAPTK